MKYVLIYGVFPLQWITIILSYLSFQVFTATGEEARVKLTDKCVKDIFKNNSELYKKGEFGVGLKNTIHDYMWVMLSGLLPTF